MYSKTTTLLSYIHESDYICKSKIRVHMKNLMIPALALFLSAAAQADDSPLWMRYCAISPDGQTIAFSYQGDIYTVPSSGGKARQLTTHPAHDTRPVWSPDGQPLPPTVTVTSMYSS